MKTFRNAPSTAFALLFFGAIFAFLFDLGGAFVCAADETTPDKPRNFNGYLLDATGLDADSKRDAAWRETFESPGVSWRYLYRDGKARVVEHRRVDDAFRGGKRSEFLRYEVETPGVVVFGHYVDYPTLFPETAPSLWVRSDRPGAALAAVVVFPKTLRPDTKTPLTAILPGDVYVKTGEWQRLSFPKDFDKLLDETIWAIRGEHEIPVDRDCAYIRQIALVSEARRGTYSLWLDDLEIAEHIRPELDSLRRSERGATFDPINLLSCRLRLTNAPIFWQNEDVGSNVYGVEPFAVDRQKVAQNQKKKLRIDGAIARKNESNVGSDALNETRLRGDDFARLSNFDDALAVLPTSAPDPFASRGDEFYVDSASGANGTRRSPSRARVGQVGFVQNGKTSRVENVAAAYSSGVAPNAANVSDENDETALVSGSGTLANSEDAATDSFALPGERLVANARFRNGFLETDDKRTYGIRAVEHQGESFEFLKKLGFNAIFLSSPPTAEMLREANRNGVWLIAPPPFGAETLEKVDFSAKSNADANDLLSREADTTSGVVDDFFNGRRATDAYDPTLIWHMGARLSRLDLNALRANVARIRNLDPKRRPIIGAVLEGVDEFSQNDALDGILLDREPFLTSLDLNDYGDWLLSSQFLSTNPHRVFWNKIQTQPAASMTIQRRYFGALETPGVISYEQMRQQVRLSMRAGCRGLVFASREPLDAKDRETQYRAAALELINLELSMINPWFAMGNAEKTILKTSDPTLGGVVSRTERSVLVAPISLERGAQYAMGADSAVDWSATVATREGYSPDLLVPGALRKIVAKRRAGGSAFTLDDGGMNSLLFFTQTNSLVQTTTERAPLFGERTSELAIKLAKMRLDLYEQTAFRLQYVAESGSAPKSAPPIPNFGSAVANARAAILEAEKFREQRDFSQAYLQAELATREIREAERNYLTAATRNEVARPVTPLSTTFYDMPGYLELYEQINAGKARPVGENLIRGGDMETSVADWTNSGWRLSYKNAKAFVATTSFESKAARDGAFGLCVAVSPRNENEVPVEVEAPTAIIETAFPSQAGKLICVQGWIKIPQDLTNSVDGVKIYDDLGGEALALRFKKATDWKRFAFYRRAANDGSTIVRFEFWGRGEVWLDDVVARVVE